jgi:hypothetical protein
MSLQQREWCRAKYGIKWFTTDRLARLAEAAGETTAVPGVRACGAGPSSECVFLPPVFACRGGHRASCALEPYRSVRHCACALDRSSCIFLTAAPTAAIEAKVAQLVHVQYIRAVLAGVRRAEHAFVTVGTTSFNSLVEVVDTVRPPSPNHPHAMHYLMKPMGDRCVLCAGDGCSTPLPSCCVLKASPSSPCR